MIGTKIKKNGEEILNKDVYKLNVDYLYIPVSSHQLKIGSRFKEGKVIGTNNNLNVHASVSGTVKDIVKKDTINGKKDAIVIKKNNIKSNNKIVDSNITKDKFIELLKDNSIIGLGGAGFPTYKKYKANNIKTLIINAVECEPYIMADYGLVREHSKEIIKTIYTIMKINDIEKCYICIKEENVAMINRLKKHIKDNIKIVLFPSKYPMGWEKLIVKKATGLTYDKLPIEKGIVVNNIATIYAIYNMLQGIPLIERIITVTGNAVLNPKNLIVKNGTLVSDILKQIKIKDEDYIIIAGGPMMGKEITEDFIITPSINCILIMSKTMNKSINCLRCGKCIEACPVGIEPVLIKDNLNNIDKLKKLNPLRCMECGLCSYVCPSNISVRDYVIEAKEKVRR